MKIEKIKIEDKISQGVRFEKEDFVQIKKIYREWIELNSAITALDARALNVPDIVSEGIFCYFFNVYRVNSKSNSKSYDAYDLIKKHGIQIKSASISNDCTSFGPNSTWDELYFMKFYPKSADGLVEIFDLSGIDFKGIILNKKKNETFKQQQEQGRRPRFSIQKEIINKRNIKPIKIIKLLED